MPAAGDYITALLLAKGLPFATYRLPGDSTVHYVVQKTSTSTAKSFSDLETEKGFVIAPFNSWEKQKFYLIRPDFLFTEDSFEMVRKRIESMPFKKMELPAANKPVSKSNYLQKAVRIINELKKGNLQKVVLSRYIYVPFEKPEEHIHLFYNLLANSYPNAFAYLFYLPEKGLWTGATPETLLQKKGEFFETVSLAGTRIYGNNISWSNKEKEEQDFVTQFIEKSLQQLDVTNYYKSPVETVKAGNLAHLKTVFRIDENLLKGKIPAFVRLLHPTPAVGGLPKEAAIKLITATEQYNRRFYTGFLGPWNLNDRRWLFVNLRCAEWTENALGLYVGGGLTAASLPEEEWRETINKSETLLAVAKKIRPLHHDIG